ncbi:primosomal protein N' [Pseudoclavibacter sp. 8L]|uniref:primosomal protein N' family DNA-binding protein n=1 Tax=Pseudoclavibacter sp. 8L TaxID=2653162 RepID=UPI0012EF7501|nr:primosomal protein N' [Pseudoclavibacter sp. 8L]VXB22789.1 putative primosomal protein N' [Pseudoclavibacter sp. 8L]
MDDTLPRVARVVVASPLPQLDRELEYEIPVELRGSIGVGMRVAVPLRTSNRQLQGFVVAVERVAEYTGKLAPIIELVSTARVLTPEIAGLARAVADRQAGCAADVLRLAIPARSVRVEQRWLEARAQAAPATAEAPGGEDAPLSDADEPASTADEVHDAPEATLVPMYGAEAAEILGRGPAARFAVDAPVGVDAGVPRSLLALAAISAVRVAAGQSVILAVPDYRDVELALRALGRFLDAGQVRRLDTRAKPADRYAAFLACLDETPGVVVGTRSVVYAPASNLGAVLVWDDGDESFTEQLAPYASTRDVALLRAERESLTLIFAAHTPSLEVARLVGMRWLTPVPLTRPEAPKVISGSQALAEETPAAHARIPALAWQEARRALEHGPVLLQVVRAGYIPSLSCARCRTPARCTVCGGALEYSRPGAPPSCRVCDALHPEWQCPECDDRRLRNTSLGAERTAEELGRAFPGTRVVVADGASETVTIDDRPCLVVATRGAEPVPSSGYAGIVLLDTERSLAQERLDAGVDALRGWSNAAALASGGAKVVIVGADNPAAHALRTWQQPAFSTRELEERRDLHFPPAIRVAAISGSDEEVRHAIATVEASAELKQAGAMQILGPTPQEVGSRAVLKFSYSLGAPLAKLLKSELVRAATSRRPRVAGRGGGHASTLRVRFDPPGIF